MKESGKFRWNLGVGTVAGIVAASTAMTLLRKAFFPKYDLAGRTVFITGGSRGLGLVLAREFGTRGAQLGICARDREELKRAASDLRARGCSVEVYACDVTDKAQMDEPIQAVQSRFGPIDVLVNNAGVISVGPLETMTLDDYKESLETHFWGPLYAMMSVLPEMRSSKAGRIVNISSIGGLVSVPHLVPYCAGKFALAGPVRGHTRRGPERWRARDDSLSGAHADGKPAQRILQG
jgi:NAD(P)-dependent dehydrogenase (short-subunit alcohol dehydrogenase family)